MVHFTLTCFSRIVKAENCSPEELQSLMHQHTEMQYSSGPLESKRRPTQAFRFVLLASHAIGILTIVLIVLWVKNYLGGFDWSKPATEFNYHPLLLFLGMVYFYGNTILSYRIFHWMDKPKLKLIHAILHGGCLICTAVGLFAVIDFHNRANIVNFYSLHSWIGIFAVLVYFLQWVGSFYSFLYPGIELSYRAFMLPFHIKGGLIVFAISIAACMTGLTEKVFFHLGKEKYPLLPSAAYYVNFIGVFIILYAIIVSYLVSESHFARKPLPSEITPSSLTMAEAHDQ